MTTCNAVAVNYDQAVDDGLTNDELGPTLIPLIREEDAFSEKVIVFQAVDDLDPWLDVWNEFKLRDRYLTR